MWKTAMRTRMMPRMMRIFQRNKNQKAAEHLFFGEPLLFDRKSVIIPLYNKKEIWYDRNIHLDKFSDEVTLCQGQARGRN
jgi:hypothetical protein